MWTKIAPLALASLSLGVIAGAVTAPGAPDYIPERPSPLPSFSAPPPSPTRSAPARQSAPSMTEQTPRSTKTKGKPREKPGKGLGREKAVEPSVTDEVSTPTESALVQETVETPTGGSESSTLQE